MMTTTNVRRCLTDAMETLLRNDGWTPDENAELPEEVKWTPDRIFTRADGKRLALEVEEEVTIPSFLPNRIESCQSTFRDTKIVISSIRNTPLTFDTAKTGYRYGIYIYADSKKPVLVLDPTSLTSVSQNFSSEFKRYYQKKSIPLILIREISKLNNVEYAPDLRDFASQYESVRFSDWEDEHRFIHDFLMKKLGRRFDATRLFEGLNVLSIFEEVSEVIAGKREHFLHSFQTFLLGAIIIDHNYDLFRKLYSTSFRTDDLIPLDLPWFFASLFHDLASPFENLEDLGPVGELFEVRPRGISALYSPHLLGCLFELFRSDSVDPEWEPQPGSNAGKLCELLAKYRKDHGVLGGINLISSATRMNRRTLTTIIYPAALAISVHNIRLWAHLIENGLTRIPVKKFPLSFLLMFCDNIEEWGRERLYHVNSGEVRPKTLITELGFDGFLVDSNLWVDEPERALVIKNRYDWITKILFDMEDLRTRCTFSVPSHK